MTLDLTFEETKQSFDTQFVEVNNVSDGGYERGLAEGEQIGYTNGYGNGYEQGVTEGYANGEADTLAKRTELTVTENGEYTPEGESTGFKSVSVNVKAVSKFPQLIDQSITEITEQDLEGVTSIGSYALYYSTLLERITIPDTVTSIGDYAFRNCTSLTELTIGEGVTSIGNNAFRSCTSLEVFIIPNGVTSIGSYAFQQCTSLKSVTIGKGLKSLPSYMFSNCTALAIVTIGDGVKEISTYVFQKCTSIESITVPDSVTNFGDYALDGCTSLKTVIFEGAPTIHNGAFKGCSAIENFSIGSFKLKNDWFKLNESPLLTVESMLNILNAVQDNTGSRTYTIYFGSTNLAKLTDEQMQIAYDKNIDLQ